MNWQLTRLSYTDFLVNEIRKDGTVLHLRDFVENEVAAQVRPSFGTSQNNFSVLVVYFAMSR
jgi:hypothetical protein